MVTLLRYSAGVLLGLEQSVMQPRVAAEPADRDIDSEQQQQRDAAAGG